MKEIEEHVTAIESVIHNEDNPASTITPIPPAKTRALRILPAGETPANSWAQLRAGEKVVDEKHAFSKDVASVKTAKTQFSLPRLTCGLMLRRCWRAIPRFVNFCMRNKPRSGKVKPSFFRASFELHRMARTRHLATSVARVLATKPEVVAGIRKRLLASDDPDTTDDAEVAIYFGDVQGEAANIGPFMTYQLNMAVVVDHILTLQQSLAHYERMLSESHPIYLQNLYIDLLHARSKGDFALVILGVAGMMHLPPLVLSGTYIYDCPFLPAKSMNDLRIPHTEHPYAPQYRRTILDFWGGRRGYCVTPSCHSVPDMVLVGSCKARGQVGVTVD